MKDILKDILCGIIYSFFILVILFVFIGIPLYIQKTIDDKCLETHTITIEEKYVAMTGQYSYTTHYQIIDTNGNVYEAETPSLYTQIEKGRTYNVETKREKSPKLIIKIEDLNDEL